MMYIYDIRKSRQGILLLKRALDLPLESVDPEYLKLNLEELNAYTIRLYIFLNATHFVTSDFKFRNEIIISESDRSTLMAQCSQHESIKLSYDIYPDQFPSENVTVVIHTVNNGLAITSNVEGSVDSYTVTNGGQISYRKQGMKSESGGAEYSLSRLFNGHNISYGFECLDMPHNNCTGVASTSQLSFAYQTEIEILSNQIPLKGFFIIDPYMLFLSDYKMQLCYTNDQLQLKYHTIHLSNLTMNGTLPETSFIETFSDRHNNKVNFWVY